MLLNKDQWSAFVGKLAGEKKVWAPVKRGDIMRFEPLEEGAVPSLDFANTTVPPKTVVFPQTETLYRYRIGQAELAVPVLEGEAVLLGVRPCDARAMSIVQKLFRWDVDDPYYLKRREAATLVGLACSAPGTNCFCTSVGGGPASTEGLDLLMTDLGESYLLEALTDKGKALLEAAQDLLQEAPAGAVQEKEKVVGAAEKAIARSVDTTGIPQGLPGLWEHPLWQRTAAGCLGCGTCTFLCPTCHCFDIQDEVEGFEG
ncbi:MAG TPA: 4Fe-4S dicluster domain-containing protein, partial [Bacillota bacterium]|nr:4Fe-4S dicluster domain-containing protein [Bacillota bacterium]